MRKFRFVVWFILGIVLALLLWANLSPRVLVKFDYCENPSIDYLREKAEDSWNNADYLKAVGESLQVGWRKSDCRLRVRVSQPFFQRATKLEEQGKLKEAIDICMTGARLVIPYDQEGVFMYGCDEMNMKYDALLSESISPTLTTTTEP